MIEQPARLFLVSSFCLLSFLSLLFIVHLSSLVFLLQPETCLVHSKQDVGLEWSGWSTLVIGPRINSMQFEFPKEIGHGLFCEKNADFFEVLFFGGIIRTPVVASILMPLTFHIAHLRTAIPQSFQVYSKSWPCVNGLDSISSQSEKRSIFCCLEKAVRSLLDEINVPDQTVDFRL